MSRTVDDLQPGQIGYVRPNGRLMGVSQDGRLWMLGQTLMHGHNDGGPCLVIRHSGKWRAELQGDLGSFKFVCAEPPNGRVIHFDEFRTSKLTTPKVPSHLIKK